MLSYRKVSMREEVYVNSFSQSESVEEKIEESIEAPSSTGRRRSKQTYIPGISKPLFHSTIRGSSNESAELFDEEYNWWKYTHSNSSSDFLRTEQFESSITAGENAVFECEVEGANKLSWLKDNRRMSDRLADRITMIEDNGVYRLEIRNITETDSGTYTARAENDCGVSFSTAHLVVEKLSDEERDARAKATNPVFLVKLKDADLLESTHARFMVKVTGKPLPRVRFYKDDKLITSKDEHIEIVQDADHPGFYEMVIPEVKLEDAGEYKCVASNRYSEESCSCSVTVTNEKDIYWGEDTELTQSTPKFSWLKNGKPFAPEERFKVIYKDEEDSIALIFQNVTPDDAGLYTCVASTTHGKISCSAELTVQGAVKQVKKQLEKPTIECFSRNYESQVAGTSIIEVRATGNPTPNVQWFKDGEEIKSGDRYEIDYDITTGTASLKIKNIESIDTGEYNVVATNEMGSDSQCLNLKIKAPPKITKKLEDLTSVTGKKLHLTVNALASPEPNVEWCKDGLKIKTSSRVEYNIDETTGSYSLIINDAVINDAGEYSVNISNENGQDSDSCRVKIESPPRFVDTMSKKVETQEGNCVSFRVIIEGNPTPDIKWKYCGKEIKHDGKRYKMSSEGTIFTMLISDVKQENAGLYSCEISNKWGSDQCDGQLFVKCSPRFDQELHDVYAKESDINVEFTVKLNSHPRATVTWFHDEAEITSKTKEYTYIEDGDIYKLIIKRASTKMSGVYKCKAENEMGVKESSAKLFVHTGPKFSKELEDVEIAEGETLKLTVSCEGVPEPQIKWYRNGKEIYSDSRIKITRDAKRIENYNLTITLIKSEDGGEYEVRATNEQGTAVTKSLISVLTKTDHKKQTKDEETKSTIRNAEDESEISEISEDGLSKSKQQTKKESFETKAAAKKAEECERMPFRKRLSTETSDEEAFTMRELRSEELTAATEIKASCLGFVEEPPENEHYIKINISRGVSIVSVSEDETGDEQSSHVHEESSHSYSRCRKNIYEFNEEDELDFEINDDLELTASTSKNENISKSFFQRHSKINETVMNAINKKLSALDGENDEKITSYSSSRKSSIIEEMAKPQQAKISMIEDMEETKQSYNARKSALRMVSIEDSKQKVNKAVSFDEQPPSRVPFESDNNDEAVEELFKRIQTQRSILGEILDEEHKNLEDRILARKRLTKDKSDDLADTFDFYTKRKGLSSRSSMEESENITTRRRDSRDLLIKDSKNSVDTDEFPSSKILSNQPSTTGKDDGSTKTTFESKKKSKYTAYSKDVSIESDEIKKPDDENSIKKLSSKQSSTEDTGIRIGRRSRHFTNDSTDISDRTKVLSSQVSTDESEILGSRRESYTKKDSVDTCYNKLKDGKVSAQTSIDDSTKIQTNSKRGSFIESDTSDRTPKPYLSVQTNTDDSEKGCLGSHQGSQQKSDSGDESENKKKETLSIQNSIDDSKYKTASYMGENDVMADSTSIIKNEKKKSLLISAQTCIDENENKSQKNKREGHLVIESVEIIEKEETTPFSIQVNLEDNEILMENTKKHFKIDFTDITKNEEEPLSAQTSVDDIDKKRKGISLKRDSSNIPENKDEVSSSTTSRISSRRGSKQNDSVDLSKSIQKKSLSTQSSTDEFPPGWLGSRRESYQKKGSSDIPETLNKRNPLSTQPNIDDTTKERLDAEKGLMKNNALDIIQEKGKVDYNKQDVLESVESVPIKKFATNEDIKKKPLSAQVSIESKKRITSSRKGSILRSESKEKESVWPLIADETETIENKSQLNQASRGESILRDDLTENPMQAKEILSIQANLNDIEKSKPISKKRGINNDNSTDELEIIEKKPSFAHDSKPRSRRGSHLISKIESVDVSKMMDENKNDTAPTGKNIKEKLLFEKLDNDSQIEKPSSRKESILKDDTLDAPNDSNIKTLLDQKRANKSEVEIFGSRKGSQLEDGDKTSQLDTIHDSYLEVQPTDIDEVIKLSSTQHDFDDSKEGWLNSRRENYPEDDSSKTIDVIKKKPLSTQTTIDDSRNEKPSGRRRSHLKGDLKDISQIRNEAFEDKPLQKKIIDQKSGFKQASTNSEKEKPVSRRGSHQRTISVDISGNENEPLSPQISFEDLNKEKCDSRKNSNLKNSLVEVSEITEKLNDEKYAAVSDINKMPSSLEDIQKKLVVSKANIEDSDTGKTKSRRNSTLGSDFNKTLERREKIPLSTQPTFDDSPEGRFESRRGSQLKDNSPENITTEKKDNTDDTPTFNLNKKKSLSRKTSTEEAKLESKPHSHRGISKDSPVSPENKYLSMQTSSEGSEQLPEDSRNSQDILKELLSKQNSVDNSIQSNISNIKGNNLKGDSIEKSELKEETDYGDKKPHLITKLPSTKSSINSKVGEIGNGKKLSVYKTDSDDIGKPNLLMQNSMDNTEKELPNDRRASYTKTNSITENKENMPLLVHGSNDSIKEKPQDRRSQPGIDSLEVANMEDQTYDNIKPLSTQTSIDGSIREKLGSRRESHLRANSIEISNIKVETVDENIIDDLAVNIKPSIKVKDSRRGSYQENDLINTSKNIDTRKELLSQQTSIENLGSELGSRRGSCLKHDFLNANDVKDEKPSSKQFNLKSSSLEILDNVEEKPLSLQLTDNDSISRNSSRKGSQSKSNILEMINTEKTDDIKTLIKSDSEERPFESKNIDIKPLSTQASIELEKIKISSPKGRIFKGKSTDRPENVKKPLSAQTSVNNSVQERIDSRKGSLQSNSLEKITVNEINKMKAVESDLNEQPLIDDTANKEPLSPKSNVEFEKGKLSSRKGSILKNRSVDKSEDQDGRLEKKPLLSQVTDELQKGKPGSRKGSILKNNSTEKPENIPIVDHSEKQLIGGQRGSFSICESIEISEIEESKKPLIEKIKSEPLSIEDILKQTRMDSQKDNQLQDNDLDTFNNIEKSSSIPTQSSVDKFPFRKVESVEKKSLLLQSSVDKPDMTKVSSRRGSHLKSNSTEITEITAINKATDIFTPETTSANAENQKSLSTKNSINESQKEKLGSRRSSMTEYKKPVNQSIIDDSIEGKLISRRDSKIDDTKFISKQSTMDDSMNNKTEKNRPLSKQSTIIDDSLEGKLGSRSSKIEGKKPLSKQNTLDDFPEEKLVSRRNSKLGDFSTTLNSTSQNSANTPKSRFGRRRSSKLGDIFGTSSTEEMSKEKVDLPPEKSLENIPNSELLLDDQGSKKKYSKSMLMPSQDSTELESVPDLSMDEDRNLIHKKKESPKILSGMDKDIKIEESDSASFEIQGSGIPHPSIEWFKDGQLLIASKHHVISEDGDKYKLEILKVNATDEGEYKAKLINNLGEDTKSAKLNVSIADDQNLQGPKLKKPLKDAIVTKGQNVELEATFIANPVPEAIWTVNDEDLQAKFDVDIKNLDKGVKECTYKVKIPSVNLSDSGTYKLRVQNNIESAESSASLTIIMEPEIEIFKDLEVPLAKSCTFEAIIKALPEADVTWYVNGKKISTRSKHKIFSKKIDEYRTAYNLTIDNCDQLDEGEYKIVAENKAGKSDATAKLILTTNQNLQGPKLKKSLENKTVTKGQKTILEAIFTGNPVPEAKWTVNDQIINAEFEIDVKNLDQDIKECTYRMMLPSTDLSNSGTYKLKVKNQLETAESSATLTIVMKPEIEMFKDIEVPAKMSCTFEAIVKSSPEAEVTWYVNGRRITSRTKHKISKEKLDEYTTIYHLTIDDCDSPDEGEYKLVAENKVGQSEAAAKLKLCALDDQNLQMPKLKKPLQDLTQTKGQPVTLEAIFIANPAPDAKWSINDRDINAELNVHVKELDRGLKEYTYKMNIPSADLSNSGVVKLKVKNQYGSAESFASLTIIMKPEIEVFKDIEVPAKMSCTFEATVKGSPEVEVTWYINDRRVTSRNKHKISKEKLDEYTTIHHLTIDDCSTSDEGVYKLVAENKAGSCEATAQLKLCTANNQGLQGPKLKKPLKNIIVTKEKEAILEATFTANPVPEAKWTINDQDVAAEFNVYIKELDRGLNEYTYKMKIPSTDLLNTGMVKLKVKNQYGIAESSASLTVILKPEIEILKDIIVPPATPCTFETIVKASPEAEVTWYVNGKKVTSRTKHKMSSEKIDEYRTKHLLTLEVCGSFDEGDYKIVAENTAGKSEATANLKLSMPEEENLQEPKLKKPLENATINRGQEISFEAIFTANPVPDVKWTVNDQDISAKFTVNIKDLDYNLKECTYQMTIPSTDLSDSGVVKIKAKNQYGIAESNASLMITMKPEIEVFKDIVVPLASSGILEAIIMSSPEAEITWYANDEKVKSRDKHKISSEKVDEYRTVYHLNVKDCDQSDQGKYKIVAENKAGKSDATANLKLYTEPPSFVKLLENSSVQDYDYVQLSVCINGLPNPEIMWYKNGKEITSNEHMTIEIFDDGQMSSLTIDHFTKDDVSEYKVKAKNIAGEAETKAKLTMANTEPSFIEPLKKKMEISTGEPLDISTKITGSPRPSVKWFKDDQEINPDDNRIKTSISPNGTLRLNINKVDASDCGTYKVVAKNDNGEIMANTDVIINQTPKMPTFLNKLENVEVKEGKPIILQVQIDGFPEPSIKWLKDGRPIKPSPLVDFTKNPNGIHGLNIKNAMLQDTGQYSAIISNSSGEDSNSNLVNVIPVDRAPVFKTPLEPLKIIEGYPVKLDVKVDGYPFPEFLWYFNKNPLNVDSQNFKQNTSPDGSHYLLIDKCTPAHAGDYELRAKNSIGETYTRAPLVVLPRSNTNAGQEKPMFLHGLKDVVIDEGKHLSMYAPFRGNPIPDLQWFKDGTKLLPNERIHFTCDGNKVSLEIDDVNMNDMGFYSCALKNLLGEDSSAGHLSVRKFYQAPIFTQQFRDIQQLSKTNAKFHCRVIGEPFPDVTWYCNGLPISNSNKYQIKRDGDICCLTILDLRKDDEGTYSCIATNREGTARCNAQLHIVDKIDHMPRSEPPQFLKKISDCEIYPGMTARFTACATGYPEPEYEWFRDTNHLHPTNRIEIEKEGSGLVRMKILSANPNTDSGRYRLRAFNPHGEAFCEANIKFDGFDSKHRQPLDDQYKDYDRYRTTGAPVPLTDKPIISRMTDRHLTLSWKPSKPIGPREPVTYLVEMEEQPNGHWFTARSGIRGCLCDIHNLKPFLDYKFRVRVENKYGTSDASPFATTHREKLRPDLPPRQTFLPPNIPFYPDHSHYFPKDFDIERPPHDNYAQSPRFLNQEHDTQYGVKGHNINLFWFVYGYPKPIITYYFNGEPIEMGGRYDSSYTRNGQASLFINKMMDRDVGIYEAVATNEHGTARQKVNLKIAEYPEFLKRPEETYIQLRKMCKLEARVIGVPYPEIKWYKDWKPLAISSRIQIEQIAPDICILKIDNVIKKDEGLYSISARNIAGSISTSVYVHIEEDDYNMIVGGKKGSVSTRNKKFRELYDLGDELGRGTQGVVYHTVERDTGKNFAAKVMHAGDESRKWMTNELDIMNHLNHRNIIRPYDSLITSKSFTIIEELASGGELLDVLTRKTHITEYEISKYIQQLLLALDHMHDLNIAHLGLTPRDILFSHPGGEHIKLTDFGLSRRINPRKLEPLFFGMPEYVAPEVAKGEGVGLSADMWSVGVITHLLLTGVSLFKGRDDVDTLDRIKECSFSVNTDISPDARDFILKLLTINANNRMDVRSALNHRWIRMSNELHPPDDRQINTENLRNYSNSYRNWYNNSSCHTWFRRQPLESAYKDISHMVYPPGLQFSPAATPELQSKKESHQAFKSWRERIPPREPINVDYGLVKSESHYQYGPDTYLLQLRDVDFPVRLRNYMKVAKRNTSEGCNWQAPVIRERRRFMDVMDEEIDDERKARINNYGSPDIYTLRRLKQEIGIRPSTFVEAEAILGSKIDGVPPFFREKPQISSIEINKSAELKCLAVGNPKPIVQWFKNDLVITECHRRRIIEDNESRSILQLNPANEFDLGIYKVVARNKFGQTIARTRLVLANEPSPPEPPEVVDISDTEILLKWKQPGDDGNSPVMCYSLEYCENGDSCWKKLADNIDHEAWLAHNLKSNTEYQFRLLAKNRRGWSTPGFYTRSVRTKTEGAEKIRVPQILQNVQTLCETGKEINETELKATLDYSLEYSTIEWQKESSREKYRFVSEITRGRFSIIVKAIDMNDGSYVTAKIIEYASQPELEVDQEFNTHKTIRHERIAYLREAFKLPNIPMAIFIIEKLQGADILTYLSSRLKYSEQMIATIITQVLDGLQYLHWRGYCHLNLQPDNVVMVSGRSLQIKLVDFGCAQHVNKLGTMVQNRGHIEYTAPEILNDEPAYPYSDIWSVGVLTYILLSGVSPFRASSDLETRQNITFVRYRFEHLYNDLSQEALRFIMSLFKRTPTKRPSAEDCHEHRWLLPTEYMIKKREKTIFDTTTLKSFSDNYHLERTKEATQSEKFVAVLGNQLSRSNSIIEELQITDVIH